MQKKPNFVKETQAKQDPLTPEIVNQRSKVNEGFEINYIIIKADDHIKLATAVNNYIGKFPFMLPTGGICFINDDGMTCVCQAMINKDL